MNIGKEDIEICSGHIDIDNLDDCTWASIGKEEYEYIKKLAVELGWEKEELQVTD